MAGERWGRATFPGVQGVLSCSYTLSHGTAPGCAALDILPQEELESGGGDLVITDGYGTITLKDCKVDRHSFERNSGGLIWRITILDRRWKWRFGYIEGRYNLRDQQGKLIKHTVKTPRELAVLCLDEAGESNYDVSALPEEEAARLPVTWEGVPPMEALASLAEQFGCRVVYQPLDDSVRVVKLGQGEQLPPDSSGGPILDGGLTLDPPERPDFLRVVCAPTLINTWFYLEAVGLDVDGRIKPINRLSYAPGFVAGATPDEDMPGSWAKCPPPTFPGLAPGNTPENLRIRGLAQQSVFRWYRITLWDPHEVSASNEEPGPEGFGDYVPQPLQVPLYGSVYRMDQLLPIEDVQAQVPLTSEDEGGDPLASPEGPLPEEDSITAGTHAPIPAVVEGVFWDGKKTVVTSIPTPFTGANVPLNEDDIADQVLNTDPHYRYHEAFSIDRENGIVQFEKYVHRVRPKPPPYQQNAAGYYQAPINLVGPAKLFLLTGVSVRDGDTGAYFRHKREFRFPDNLTFNTKARTLKQDDLRLVVVPDYDDYEYTVPTIDEVVEGTANENAQTNAEAVNEVADYYLKGAALEYQVGTPEERSYGGIHPIFCDGAIQQVTWSIGGSGATTRAGRNTEIEVRLPSYQVLRQGQRDRRAQKKVEALKADSLQRLSDPWKEAR